MIVNLLVGVEFYYTSTNASPWLPVHTGSDVRSSYIIQTEVLDPYPHSNGGQQLGALKACPFLPLLLCISTSFRVLRAPKSWSKLTLDSNHLPSYIYIGWLYYTSSVFETVLKLVLL